MAGQQAANEDGEAKLSAAYASRYYVAPPLATADNVEKLGGFCANCGTDVAPIATEEREPLCTVCWSMLRASIKRAAAQGFRIG